MFDIYCGDKKRPKHTLRLTVFSHNAAQSYVSYARYMIFRVKILDKEKT